MSAIHTCIKDVLFRTYPRNTSTSGGRQRALEFEEDLFEHAGKRLDWRTVADGGGYSYTELGSPVLDDLKRNEMLDNVGSIVLAYWTPEYNPEHSAFGMYFLKTYVPGGTIADVCDRGSVGAFAALKLAHAQLVMERATRPADRVRDIVVVGFEQTTIARDARDHLPVPLRSSAGAIVLSARATDRAGKLLDAGVEPESTLQEGRFRLAWFVNGLCERLGIDPAGLTVLMPFDCFVGKHYRYRHHDRPPGERTPFAVQWAPTGVTSMRLFEQLHVGLRGDLTREQGHTLLIDEDVETLALGWAMFEGPRAWRKGD
ncbi:hypothetical protein DID96_15190 [Burkholderia sp. Bp8963]|uniref:hypothetical protein n=1 Tax=Burkholderia sp. Bp8963 TaxID=2184547 RepID=UPI000F596EDE|nr:hypothetical protein [Burkholderia sp. Bp8963]RQS70480.1 hypothetical protein DID96_15190 [Burkholderia sp. Bp8963]